MIFGAGDSPTLVFQHGLCGGQSQIREALGAIPNWRGLECPGHGGNPLTAEVSIPAFATHVIALIESLGTQVTLGGISMGAAIATRVAVVRPDLVRALILIRPAWVTDKAPANMEPNAEVGRLIAKGGTAAEFAISPTAQRLAQEAPDNLTSLLGFFTREPLAETARLLQEISADGPGITEADLRSLHLPTLVCGCPQDAIHPLSHAERLATLIPGARLQILPPKTDKPAHLTALQAAMTQFLKETQDAPRP